MNNRPTPETDAASWRDRPTAQSDPITLYQKLCEMVDEIETLKRERDEALNESLEQARLLGISGEWGCRLIAERNEARENCKSIVDKANELIARWDQPSWKDTTPTARFINALRIAVRAYEKKKL